MAFFRLVGLFHTRLISLKPGVLAQCGFARISNAFVVRDVLIVGLAGIGLTQIANALGVRIRDQDILITVRFLLATVVKCLFFRIFGLWRRRSVPSMVKSSFSPRRLSWAAN